MDKTNKIFICDVCDVCDTSNFKLYKCNNQCNYNTCVKCYNKLENHRCPNCRGHFYPKFIVLKNEIKNKYECFRARKLVNNKILKTTIKHNLFKDYFKHIYESLKRNNDDYEDYIQEFENLDNMLTKEMELYEKYLEMFCIQRLERIANKVS